MKVAMAITMHTDGNEIHMRINGKEITAKVGIIFSDHHGRFLTHVQALDNQELLTHAEGNTVWSIVLGMTDDNLA